MAKQSTELTARLKLKHAQALKMQERQDLLESDLKRYDKVHAEAEKQRAKIAELLEEIEELEEQILRSTISTAGARTGFMDLEPALVTALQKAGLEWGGEWAGSKDFMHFEVK